MSSRSCETAGGGNEHRRDEQTEERSQLPTAQKLLGYVTSQTNPLAKYVEEITSQVHAVVQETEKVTVRCHKEVEASTRKLSELETKILDSEKKCERYRKERDELRQRASGDREVQQLKRELAEQRHKYDRDHKEWEKKLKDLEETNDAIIKAQKLQIDQAQRDLRHREADVVRLKEKIEDSKFGFSDISVLRKKLEDSQKQLNDTNDKLHWAKTKLKETEKELDDTKTR
ncbi:mitotic spindle assembly checkpoint protein MAD1-like [Mercenaria mercenaria]|uniref:mitotic spindle assembly checkpoint protein MAD1-like n=1 Tax=Mercenaria mercenaria TaxID=6596 RepID=UPI00234E972A|nr:mitotic spindle assembly checkpoint protein MAD1-like [Mercenaria mercenaria]